MKSPEAYNKFKNLVDPVIKDEYWYKTSVLPLIIISVLEVMRNDPMGKNMGINYYNNNPKLIIYSNKNSKEMDIENIINHIFNNYLYIIMDINKYSQKLHDNLLQIYPSYLFSMILKMANFDNLCNTQNIQQEYENNNSNINNSPFAINFGPKLNNNNSYLYIE